MNQFSDIVYLKTMEIKFSIRKKAYQIVCNLFFFFFKLRERKHQNLTPLT